MPLHGYILWEDGVGSRYILGECGWVDIFYWCVGLVGGIFWVGRSGWGLVRVSGGDHSF